MVAQCCKAVIACRARKDQKAKLTRLVRKGNREVVTLGVGDGANDVEKANRILGEFEAQHPGLLAARMHCEVGFGRCM